MTIAVALAVRPSVRPSSELPAAAGLDDDGHKIHCRKEFGVTDDDDDQRREGEEMLERWPNIFVQTPE